MPLGISGLTPFPPTEASGGRPRGCSTLQIMGCRTRGASLRLATLAPLESALAQITVDARALEDALLDGPFVADSSGQVTNETELDHPILHSSGHLDAVTSLSRVRPCDLDALLGEDKRRVTSSCSPPGR